MIIVEAAGTKIAGGYIDRIEAACMALATFPKRGTLCNDILPGQHTVLFERRATIAFRMLKTRVEVITVAYGGRDFEGELRSAETD
jgi:toxin ParE1/3/4